MYSWIAIRAFCVVLLLLPLLHLVILLSRDTLALLDSSPTTWQPEMDAYIQADEDGALPERPVEVIGGRRVALWRNLENIDAPRPILVRSLGDATVADLAHYHQRLVGYYRPEVLVVLPGNSELHIRDSKSAGELVNSIRELARLDASHDSERLFYVFAPIKTVLHPGDHGKIDDAGARLQALAGKRPNLRVLDANPLLASAGSAPNPAFFRADGVHLNEAGYLRLELLLRRQFRADFPEHYPDSGPL